MEKIADKLNFVNYVRAALRKDGKVNDIDVYTYHVEDAPYNILTVTFPPGPADLEICATDHGGYDAVPIPWGIVEKAVADAKKRFLKL
jgi:hypothetical protein